MALQLVVDSLETVPETVRSLYVQEGDKFKLDVSGIEDTSGLKSALQKEREAARTAAKQASAWASLGKTPEEIQELLEAQRKAEEDKAAKGGEWEKLKAQMQEHHTSELSKKDQLLKAKDAAIERFLVGEQAVSAISELKGSSFLLLPHVKASVKVVDDDGEYVVRVIDAQGNPRVNAKGDFLTIKDLVSEMRQSEEFGRAFEASGTTGGGSRTSSANGSRTMSEAAFNALSPKERAKRMAEGYVVT